MSQPRHKRKRSIVERDGQAVHVTRLLDTGDVVEYDATLRLEIDPRGHVGRALLERIKFIHACARIGAYQLFIAAADLPIKGFPDWWMISNFPVELSRHTRGRTYTRAVMDMLAVFAE